MAMDGFASYNQIKMAKEDQEKYYFFGAMGHFIL